MYKPRLLFERASVWEIFMLFSVSLGLMKESLNVLFEIKAKQLLNRDDMLGVLNHSCHVKTKISP